MLASGPIFLLLLWLVPSFCLFTTESRKSAELIPSAEDRPPRRDYYRICPFPRCETCPSDEELRAPGIGLALDIDHGTAVVRLHNGTFRQIGLIEGDPSYTALMRRLATGPIDRVPDHIDDYWEKLQYAKSRARRLSNKLLGLPATPETAILAPMVLKLIEATQTRLGDEHPIVAAVLSSPDRIRLTHEELGDIFDYLKIQNLISKSPLAIYQLYSASAAYAGYGKGLCRAYLDAYECDREEWYLPNHRVLHVDFSPKSLSGTLKTIQRASSGSVISSFVDLNLGLGRKSQNGSDEEYWTAVSHRIRELAKICRKYVFIPHVTELLLSGPSASDSQFHSAVKEALHDLVADESVLAVLEDRSEAYISRPAWESFLSFATAQGAAEIAKRRQEGPVYCKQTDDCRKKRKRVHGEQQSLLLNQQPNELEM